MLAFQKAVETKDLAALAASLAPDVTLRSPVVFEPYVGREAVCGLLAHIAEVFQDFRYVSEVHDGARSVLRFHARVGKRELDGIDFLEHDVDGRVKTLIVYVRPQSAALALIEAMRGRLEAAAGSAPR